MHIKTAITAHDEEAARTQPSTARMIPLLGIAMIGLTLVFIAGFAGPELIHNTAHDALHAAAFPCH